MENVENHSFFIVVGGNITPYLFNYLSKDLPTSSVEPTLSGGVPTRSEEKKSLRVFVRDLMTTQVVSVRPEDNFDKVKRELFSNGIHHLPVTNDKKIYGLISKNDIQRVPNLTNKTLAKEIMTKTVLCSKDDVPLENILEIFINEDIHSVIVVDNEFTITGILTQNDIFRWLLNEEILKS